jgi:hypothetical protein
VKQFSGPAIKFLTIALLVLGAARASLLVFDEPVTGYANQFDMKRISACLGVWPVTDQNPRAMSPAAPFAAYEWGETDEAFCQPGTEVLLAGLVTGLAGIFSPDYIDIRWVGGTKLILLLLIAISLHLTMRQSPYFVFAHALVFALVICDPMNTLFANSFYSETGALLGAYLAIGAAIAIVLQDHFRVHSVLLWLVGLALLGGSRVQHLLLPLILFLLLVITLRKVPGYFWVTSLLLSAAVIFLQFGLQGQKTSIDDANRINTVFGTILPAHPEPGQLAERLGLPENCADLANTSWYLKRGRNHREDCPEAFELSRAKIIMVFVQEPAAGVQLLFRALYQTGAWRLPYVGEVANASFKKAGGVNGLSIAGLLTGISFSVYVILYLLPVWLGICAFMVPLGRKPGTSAELRAFAMTLSMLAGLVMVVNATALFGDGFSEYGRHAHLAQNACAAAWLLMLVAVLQLSRRTRPRGHYPAKTPMRFALAGSVIMILAVPVLIPKLALGYGVLNEPVDERVPGSEVLLSGWVAEPNGVERVEVINQNGVVTPLPHRGSRALRPYFPIGELPAEFSAVLKMGENEADRTFRIVVTSKSGQKTTIDRRFMSIKND